MQEDIQRVHYKPYISHLFLNTMYFAQLSPLQLSHIFKIPSISKRLGFSHLEFENQGFLVDFMYIL